MTCKDILRQSRNQCLCKIRTAYIANEKRVAGDDSVHFSIFVDKQVASAFHGVTRRMDRFYGTCTDLEFLSVFGNQSVEFRFGCRSVDNGTTGFCCEVEVARNKICVEMRLENVFDF